MAYPQNGDRIVAIDSVTSLHLIYYCYTVLACGRVLPHDGGESQLVLTLRHLSPYVYTESDEAFLPYERLHGSALL